MKTTVPILFLSLLLPALYAEAPIVLPDLRNPLMMIVDANNYYFSDQHSVFIFNKNDNQLVQSLCKEGQGPWEVRGTPGFCVTPKNIFIFDIPKVILFDNELKPVKEINLGISTSDWKQSVLDDHIVFAQEAIINRKLFNRIFIFDPISGEKRQMCQIEPVEEDKSSIYTPLILMTSNNCRFFITNPLLGFHIDVFDDKGAHSHTINYDAQKIKGTAFHKKRFYDRLVEAVGQLKADMFWPRYEKMDVPSVMPEIKWMLCDDERLYIQTYDIRTEEDKWLIFSQKGAFLGECWLPLVHVRKAAIFKNRFYYLLNTEDGWALQSVSIPINKKNT